MKRNHLVTTALLALGLISSASAFTTTVISGVTYNVVYITGSTAFRPNLFAAVENNTFDSTPTLQPTTATSSSSAYNVYGNIGGTPYLLSVDLTGSEAGLAALEGTTISNPNTASSLAGFSSGTVNLAGTPQPTGFINPNGGAAITAAPDLALADTSQAVSLSAAKPALKDFGVVAIIPFEWVKGKFSSPDSSWTDLVNLSDAQLGYQLSGSQLASFFTGNAADQDDIYVVGRNKGSGTRVNTLLDAQYGVTTPVDQWVPANSTYVAGVLTVGTVENLNTAGGLVEVANDGFDAGSGVGKTLTYDLNGASDQFGPIITIGYVGLSDAGTATTGGGVALTLNGVAENDATVQNGTYSFWGHEHLYGLTGNSSTTPPGVVGIKLAGSTPNETQGTAVTTASEHAALFQQYGTTGGREATPSTTQSTALDPATVHANKPSDAGYPAQQN